MLRTIVDWVGIKEGSSKWRGLVIQSVWHQRPDIGLQPSRKRGPPLSKWDDMLPNIVKQYFPLSEQSFDTISLHILWTFTPVFSPFPYGIVVVMFEIRAGAKQNTHWTLHFEEHLLIFFSTNGGTTRCKIKTLTSVREVYTRQCGASTLRLAAL